MKISLFAAVLCMAAACANAVASPAELVESMAPQESDVVDITYSTVLDTTLSSDFTSNGRLERDVLTRVAGGDSFRASNQSDRLSPVFTFAALVALIACIALFVNKTIKARMSAQRRGCYSQLVKARRVTSPRMLRPASLGITTSSSFHDFGRFNSLA
jgi:hypothetical protein